MNPSLTWCEVEKVNNLASGMTLYLSLMLEAEDAEEQARSLKEMDYNSCAKQFHATLAKFAAMFSHTDFLAWSELTDHQRNSLSSAVRIEYNAPSDGSNGALALLVEHDWLGMLFKTRSIKNVDDLPFAFRHAGSAFKVIVSTYRKEFNSKKD